MKGSTKNNKEREEYADHTVAGFTEKQVLYNKTSETLNNSGVTEKELQVSMPAWVKASSSSKGTSASTQSVPLRGGPAAPGPCLPTEGLPLHKQVLPRALCVLRVRPSNSLLKGRYFTETTFPKIVPHLLLRTRKGDLHPNVQPL